jgi:hypothetical protein
MEALRASRGSGGGAEVNRAYPGFPSQGRDELLCTHLRVGDDQVMKVRMSIYEEPGGKLHRKHSCPDGPGRRQMKPRSISKAQWLELDRQRFCHCLRRWHQDSPPGKTSPAAESERSVRAASGGLPTLGKRH